MDREVESMSATSQETFEPHVAALLAGDVDAIAAHYTEDALVLTPTGQYRGRAAIRELYAGLVGALPDLSVEAQVTAFADNALLLHWTADSTLNTILDGVDTFVFDQGAISLQTISCTMTPKA
jgi:ketosteroid isomerase-like protein